MARRQVKDAERSALRAWIEIAKTPPDQPLPEPAAAMVREVAEVVAALAMSGVPTTKAAKVAATFAGLTGVAIADFRSEQDDLRTAMYLLFNTHSKFRVGKVEHGIADVVSDKSARQAFRRRARALKSKNQQ